MKAVFQKVFATILFLFFLFIFPSAIAQQKKESRDFLDKKNRFIVVPTGYYLPETNIFLGLAAFGYFKTNRNDSILRASYLRGALGYTLNKQYVFWLPFEVYFKQNNYLLQGELGYYRWPYVFNGIGNNYVKFYEERYTGSFPRFRINFSKRFGKGLYIGPNYWFQDFVMNKTENGGLLFDGSIAGSTGGRNSGLGFSVVYDTRNNIYSPSKGRYYQLFTLFNSKAFGSHFDYNTYQFDFREYFTIFKSHLIAVQWFTKFNFGNPPFNQMSQLGGNRLLRGYLEGRYRDKHALVGQIEYRSAFYKRIGFAVFTGFGIVADQFADFKLNNSRPNIGGGLRYALDQKQGIHIRADYAFGQGRENRYFYFTLSEAF